MNANDPKILVVDDDAEMVSVLCDVLRDAIHGCARSRAAS